MKILKLILASQSPRRKEILEMAGMTFVVRPADADETLPAGVLPSDAVLLLSSRKATAALSHAQPDEIVLAADTIVALEGKILGKPDSPRDAVRMLKMLSGKAHEVYTGVCVASSSRTESFFCRTEVVFYSLSDAEIEKYVATGEPLDKAGAYGIQGMGSLLVKEIHGDYFNVMGLPAAQTARLLAGFSESGENGVFSF
ncbi:MAG: septum formation inhibitor Maf [Clostridiales bacterium]|nr:septum formation inhibitor Maf [Clostridiales bacterium]